MAIKAVAERGSSASSVARTLGVTEGAVRYHLQQLAAGAVDGRAGKPHMACGWHEPIATWLAERDGRPVNLKALQRLGGVPATMRIDNQKTAIVTDSGAWGEFPSPTGTHQAYQIATNESADSSVYFIWYAPI